MCEKNRFSDQKSAKSISINSKQQKILSKEQRRKGHHLDLYGIKTIALMRNFLSLIVIPCIKHGTTLLMIFALCLLACISRAQNTPSTKLITGKVTDTLGRPVEGASVIIKGTQKGILSDSSG